jgi:alpha-tubulin suppressor-like RCC1 family protein
MKQLYKLLGVLAIICSFFLAGTRTFAQCNVNDKYDKIISGYHSSIALKDNGTFAVWGSAMQKNGSSDQLAPQDINSTNYTGLTGTIYKAALGGQSAGTQVDQGILLTSDGLWAWGITGKVLSTTLKSTATFGRITSPSGGVGSTTLGLPTGINPTDVQSLFATYQTLVLLTKIVNGVGGDVYILTQTSRAVEANGGTVTTAGQSNWQKVKTGASTYLTNVTAVRGQVYNASNNAFIALTSSGQVYTWGNTTYLGNSTAIAARNYATQMTLPAEFSTSIPKMIGVTGGGGTGATSVTNTYFILSNAGNLYSLGNNSQRQCGDFTTNERTAWVQVKKSAAANDYLSNVNFFSCQEHNASFPTIAAITTSGTLYTWGSNSSGMAGRTDDGTAGGSLNTTAFDPGIPVGFSSTAISVEVGGHTMVYLSTGSTQFCYVGHYTNGSMGDGTSGNNGSASATTLKHDCSGTPSLSICGYVPVTGSAVKSTIGTSPTSIVADGVSTTTVTIQLKDASGNNLTSSGGSVIVTATGGTLGTVIDNNNGTYTVTLTSSTTPGPVTIGFSLNGVSGTATVQVQFTSFALPLSWLNASAYRQGKTEVISWATAQEVHVSHFEIERSLDGSNWKVVGNPVQATNLTSNNRYKQTDNDHVPGRVYYRVRQYDIDGRSSYSATMMLAEDNGTNKISIYPVPALAEFKLMNADPDKIKQVELYTLNGSRTRSWKLFQSSYDVQDIPPGIYVVRVEMVDGNVQSIRLDKR